jgi:hypothetical protein
LTNRREVEAIERAQRRERLERLSTEELREGLRLGNFPWGGNTIAKEILRERGESTD